MNVVSSTRSPQGNEAVDASGLLVVAENALDLQHRRTVMSALVCLRGSYREKDTRGGGAQYRAQCVRAADPLAAARAHMKNYDMIVKAVSGTDARRAHRVAARAFRTNEQSDALGEAALATLQRRTVESGRTERRIS